MDSKHKRSAICYPTLTAERSSALANSVAEPPNEPAPVRVASIYPPWALASAGSRTASLAPGSAAVETSVQVSADRNPMSADRNPTTERSAEVERNATAERAATKPAAAPRAAPTRPGALLNDAQIASIKSRLKLTPEQQRHWPAVEAALQTSHEPPTPVIHALVIRAVSATW